MRRKKRDEERGAGDKREKDGLYMCVCVSQVRLEQLLVVVEDEGEGEAMMLRL